MSRVGSATAHLSRAFSRSCSFRRFGRCSSIPPYYPAAAVIRVLGEIPSSRRNSTTDMRPSACRKAKAICSSINRFFTAFSCLLKAECNEFTLYLRRLEFWMKVGLDTDFMAPIVYSARS